MVCVISLVAAAPQFFGQSFSSSTFVGPNGEVVENSFYSNSDGTRIVNGIQVENIALQPQSTSHQANSIAILNRPDFPKNN